MKPDTTGLDLFPRVERWLATWVFVSVAVLGFAIFVSTSNLAWFYDPTSIDKRIRAVEERAIEARPRPRVIIFGSSRAAFGLVPATIERALNLPPLSVASWAYPGFGLYPYQTLLDAHKDQIAAAETIIVQIDPYFALNHPYPATNVSVTAGVERNWAMEINAWVSAAVTRNWAVEINTWLHNKLSARVPVQEKMAWFLNQLGGRLGLFQPYSLVWVMLPGGNWEGSNNDLSLRDAAAESAVIARSYYKGKLLVPEEAAAWTQFFRNLAALNRRVVLFYVPSSPTFEEEEGTYRTQVGESRRLFENIAKENGFVLAELRSADCGLDNKLFADPIHVNHTGRERLSECFAHELARRSPR